MNIKFLLIFFFMFNNYALSNQIEIKPIEQHQVTQARTIILNAILELQIIPCSNLKELEKQLKDTNELYDLDNINQFYTDNKGIFLVMLKNNETIGMGAIKYFDQESCELKRMFFAKEYRGQGYGSKILEELINYAKTFGYKKIKLDVYNSATQIRAIKLYEKFGFYKITAYKNSKAMLFMEKNLLMPKVNILNLDNKLNKDLEQILKITNIYDKILAHSKNNRKSINQSLIEITQKEWLRKSGTERSELTGLHEDKLDLLMPYFIKLDLFSKINPTKDSYDYAIILGSLTEDVIDRIVFLEQCIKNINIKQLVVLSGMRLLTDQEKSLLKENYNIDYNLEYETDMILFILQKTNLASSLKLLPLTVVNTLTDHPEKRPTTNDTIDYWLKKFNPKTGTCLAVSSNPYIGYQESALKSILPKEFAVEVVGDIDKDLKLSNTKVALILDSLARWIYQENSRLNK